MAEHGLRKRTVGLVSRIEFSAHPLRKRSGEGVETVFYILVLFFWSVLGNGHDSESSMFAVFNVALESWQRLDPRQTSWLALTRVVLRDMLPTIIIICFKFHKPTACAPRYDGFFGVAITLDPETLEHRPEHSSISACHSTIRRITRTT